MPRLTRSHLVPSAALWAVTVLGGLSAAFAEGEAQPPAAPAVPAAAPAQTLQGEVVDPAAYLKEGRRGSDAVERTFEAVDGGQTLALLQDGTDTLYLFLAEEPGEDPNELVYDHVNQRMKITGNVYARSGMHGIVVSSAEPIEPPETAAPAAPTPPPAPAQ